MKLTAEEKQFLIQKIAAGDQLPDDFQEKLFPTLHKEYELRYAGKMRKEDLLADQDGTFAVPLQIEKLFNGEREIFDDAWKNMIVFGDNLQFLKTLYADKDDLIRGKVKGKVRLIYIDPPFGTGDEYDGNNGQRGYTARVKGAEFIEFLRRRLILAKELLAPNGAIFIRLDYHFGHYAKVIMDEVFGKENFQNEFVVNRVKKNVTDKGRRTIPNAVDNVYVYFRSTQTKYIDILKKLSIGKKGYWHSMDSQGVSGPRQAIINGVTYFPPTGTHFKYTQVQVDEKVALGKIRINPNTNKPQYWVEAKEEVALDSNWTDIPGYTFTQNYPTENSEQLLERVIRSASETGDIVMDFFGGSGTTAAVAEKLNRKWIICDIGKLSFYTIQKRMLTIQDSKDLLSTARYIKRSKSFITVNTGLYDIEKLKSLEQNKYVSFVLDLFEVISKPHKINGVQFHGVRKDDYSVLVWDYINEDHTKVDETYLENLHHNVGKRIGSRVYIIAPANAVQFIGDFHEIDSVRYYFLKIPYQIINELHKEPFSKIRQPQSKSKINDLENAIGFHFMHQPDVESSFKNGHLKINNYPFEAGGATGKIIDISINILPRLYFCAPAIIILIIIVLKRSSVAISIWFRLLSMPAILFLALFYSINLTSIVADFMDASEKTLEVYSEDGDKRFKITKNCVDSCQKVALSTRIFFKNMGKSDFYIRKAVDTLTLTELRDDEADTSVKTINLKLNKIDEDPNKALRVLKTGETCILDYLDTVSAKEWQFWWAHTLPAKHLPGVKARFEYITTWTA